MYAILKSAEFYGPETVVAPVTDDRNRVITHKTRKAAQEYVDGMQVADRAEYGCPILEHNQASAWAYIVRRLPSGRAMWRGAYLPD